LIANELEYVELYNNGATSMDLSGWQIGAVQFKADFGTTIASKSYLLIARNTTAFKVNNILDF
jgi:hypothetical protein